MRAGLHAVLGLGLAAAVASAQGQPSATTLHRPFRGFVENRGQWATEARFVAEFGDLLVRAEPGAMVVQAAERDRSRVAVVRLVFEGAEQAAPRAGERLPGEHHFFLGHDAARWRRGVPAFADVVYPEAAAGTDVRLYARDGRFEYDVALSPTADVGEFVVRCEGIDGLALEPDGDLRMDTALGPLVQHAPIAWQRTADGESLAVACSFRILGPQRFGLQVPGRRPGASMLIDPGLTWASFLGGSELDEQYGVEITPAGDILALGRTSSADFPTTAGVFVTDPNSTDVTLTCVDPGGAELVFSTHFGGTKIDIALALAVDANGRIAVGGYTNSTDYPVLPDAFDTSLNSLTDAFVSVLAADGSQLLLSTYLGGGQVRGIGFGASGRVVAAGTTGTAAFPSTPDGFDPTYGGSAEGFILWLDPALAGQAQLASGSFLGGSLYDEALALAMGPDDQPIVVGRADSTDFPTTPGAYDETAGGHFITRISADGTAIVASTFFNDVFVNRVTTDGDTILVTGSPGVSLPVLPNAFDKDYSGSGDAFVARFDGQLSRLMAATYIGGSGNDDIGGILVDSSGRIVIAGVTASPDYPTTPGAYDTVKGGSGVSTYTSMVSCLSADLSQLVYSSFLGPSPGGWASDVAVFGPGDVALVGSFAFCDFPVTPGAFDVTCGGNDGYVARMQLEPSTWGYMDGALPGYAGLPQLTAVGDLGGGHLVRFTLTSAAPSTPVTFVVGFSQAFHPFKGGWLVPSPDLLITGFATSQLGSVTLSGLWPPGIPSGLTFYCQCWMKDAVALGGFAASNGLSGTTP